MKKLFAIVLVIVIGSVSIANIVEFFEEIPPAVKYAVGTVISVYAVSWAYSWFFDPIVIVAGTTYGAFNFGPFIVVSPDIYYHEQETVLNHVLNHEYVHYVQHAIYGPILSLTYPVASLYSILTSGNQWSDNFWEQQAISLATNDPPQWQPALILELGGD